MANGRAVKRGRVRGGASKLLGEAYLADIADAGVPLPRSEVRFHPVRRWKVDAYWPEVDLVVEIEGGTGWKRPGNFSHHISPDGYRNDCEKYNALMERGIEMGRPITLLRFTGAMVADKTARDTTARVYALLGGVLENLKGREDECEKRRRNILKG